MNCKWRCCKKMKAVVKRKAEKGAEFVENFPIPKPGPKEVLVKIKATAICGTDIHIYDWSEWAQGAGIKFPLVLGHECSGEIIEVGNEVKESKIGDYVACETHIFCGTCFQCKNGTPHICQNLKAFGAYIDGCFAEYTVLPEKCIYKIPDTISPEIGALLEPLGPALRACMELQLTGDIVAIIGCGPIGLLSLASAKAMGASKIIAIDVIEDRLKLAKDMGAYLVLNPKNNSDIVGEIMNITDGIGVDSFIEASGNIDAINQGFKYLRKGGKIAFVGLPSKKLEINLISDIVFKEAKIIGIHGREIFRTWTKMVNMLTNGNLNISPIITNIMPLEKYQEAFQLLDEGCGCKIVLIP